ncbi:MAG: 4Fe-4S dicluster domain-containing protein [bacterium]
MSQWAMLIDETRCTGCRACQVACKQWNDLPAEATRNRGTYQNPPALSASTWSLIEFHEVDAGGAAGFYFLKRACMHCEHPACASVCPVGAMHKTPQGPVLYDDRKCIGCRYCMAACPFGVPAFEWEKGLLETPVVRKCTFCFDRLGSGLHPACAKTCPSKAIAFGAREALIEEGEARIRRNPNRYVDRLYGKQEAGGTSVLYLSAIPFERLGLPRIGPEPVAARAEKVMEYTVPFAAAWGAALAGLALLFRFRDRAGQQAPAEEKEEPS